MGTDDFGRDIFRRLLKGGRMTMTVGAIAVIMSAIIGNKISESQRIIMIMVILGLLSWTGLARLVRGSVLAEREHGYHCKCNA